MKRNRIGCTLAGLLLTVAAGAQIPNSGFEIMNADNKISQWGKTFLTMVIIDSNGNSISDSIVMDNAWYFATPEAHSGQQAMEMRNAYNYNSGDQLAGGAFLSADESYSPNFLQLVEIAPVQPPERLNFWYQFIPAGPDTATATLTLYDVDGIQMGEAALLIGQATNGYTLADVPIVYTQPGAVHYISMSFSTNVPYGPATFGTRFLVDDVSLEGALDISEETMASVSVGPNPASGWVTITSAGQVEQVSVVSVSGQEIAVALNAANQIDCSRWEAGIYLMNITTSGHTFSKKIMIEP